MSYCFYGNYSLYTSPSVSGRGAIDFSSGPESAATRRARFLSQPNLRMFGAASSIKYKAESIQATPVKGQTTAHLPDELVPLTTR